MAKLYFKYGSMGSSKTAQALITRFNYEEGGNKVWLIKPTIDTRDGDGILRSRIGLEAPVEMVSKDLDLYQTFMKKSDKPYVIIIDEAQFLTTKQVDQLRKIVDTQKINILCYGLRTDFQTKLFPGSKRLFELAESIQEIKSICQCGRKASVNARLGQNNQVITEGEQVAIGGNDLYQAMCYQCYRNKQK